MWLQPTTRGRCDPTHPYRRFELFGNTTVQLQASHLDASAQLFKSQAERQWQHQCGQSSTQKSMLNLLASSSKLPTLAELRTSAEVPGPSSGKSALNQPPDDGEDDGTTESEGEAEGQGATEAASDNVTPQKKTPGAASSPGFDTMSVATARTGGKVRLSDEPSEPGSVPQSVAYWIERLPLSTIMLQGSLGRERHQAEECIARLQRKGKASDAAILQKHIRLAKSAETVRPKVLGNLCLEDRTGHLQILHQAEVDFPSEIKQAVWQCFFNDISQQVKAGNDACLQPFWKLMQLLPKDGEAFSPLAPTLATLDGSPTEKAGAFLKKLKDVWFEGLYDENRRSFSLSLAREGLKFVALDSPDDIDVSTERVLYECKICFECIIALVGSTDDTTFAARVTEVLECKTAGAMRSLKDVIKSVPYLEQRSLKVSEFWVKAQTYMPKLQEDAKLLQHLVETRESLDSLAQLVRSLAGFQASLPESMVEEHADKLLQKLKSTIATLMVPSDATLGPELVDRIAVSKQLVALLVVCCDQFPKEKTFVGWRSDIHDRLSSLNTDLGVVAFKTSGADFLKFVVQPADFAKHQSIIDAMAKAATEVAGIQDDDIQPVAKDTIVQCLRMAGSIDEGWESFVAGSSASIISCCLFFKVDFAKLSCGLWVLLRACAMLGQTSFTSAIVALLVDSSTESKAFVLTKVAKELQAACKTYTALGQTATTRVGADSDHSSIGVVVRLLDKVTSFKDTEQWKFVSDFWGVADILDSATKLVEEAASVAIEAKLQPLREVLADLQPIAGGSTDGSDWDVDIKPEQSIDEIYKVAAESLQKLDANKLIRLMVAGQQVAGWSNICVASVADLLLLSCRYVFV